MFEFVQKYVNKMKKFQELILDFIEKNESNDQFFENFNKLLDLEKIRESRHEMRLVLNIISQISNYHYRAHNFFIKIKTILLFLKDDINKNFTNNEITFIFKANLPIIVILYEEKIITPEISSYYEYNLFKDSLAFLTPELKLFFDEFDIINAELKYPNILKELETESFQEKRKIGENDSYICQLIRDDSIDEFVKYVNKLNLSLSNTNIQPSFFETNELLMKNQSISLIEYAAFFGSIQIFNYLRLNGVALTPSLWIYAIHSNNPELIHILEEFHIKPKEKAFNNCLIESIKCHHNDIAIYIQNNLLNNNEDDFGKLQFYNFSFFSQFIDRHNDILNDKNKRNKLFYDFCKNGCYELVEYFLNNINVDINSRII